MNQEKEDEKRNLKEEIESVMEKLGKRKILAGANLGLIGVNMALLKYVKRLGLIDDFREYIKGCGDMEDYYSFLRLLQALENANKKMGDKIKNEN